MTNIIDFIKTVAEQIKQGFKAFTIYKNSNNQHIIQIGSYSLTIDMNEVKLVIGIVSLLLMILASVDNSISQEAIRYLDINTMERVKELTNWTLK